MELLIELDELMSGVPAICVSGCKGVGKTVTAKRRSTTIYELDDDQQIRLLASHDRALRDAPPGTVLIDEWQRLPSIWDRVRRAVDEAHRPGDCVHNARPRGRLHR